MEYSIRDATTADLDTLLNLNEVEVPHVGSLAMDDMQIFLDMASYFRVACGGDGEILASLIGLAPGAEYASLNYRWFDDRYKAFAYIDRICVAPTARRLGLAGALYRDFEDRSSNWAEMLCCEVNLVPENPVSMAYHRRLGFEQVGTLDSKDGKKTVALLIRAC